MTSRVALAAAVLGHSSGAGQGFTELGRMAGEYRQLFGELPSETLGRGRVLPSTRLADALPEAPATAP